MSFIKDIFHGVEESLMGTAAAAAPIIVNKGATTDVIPGDINIVDITISSEDGQRKETLIGMCTSIDIFESILTPGIFCELTLNDSRRLYQDFPLLKEELITISFETPNNPGNPTKYIFHVNDIRQNSIHENQKTQSYTLQGISPELLINAKNFVNKDYKDTISNVVENIMDEMIKTKKKVEIEKTIGIDNHPSFNSYPFKYIHSLMKYAMSDRYKSHAYIFFENKHGYHLTTYEKLIEQGRQRIAKGLSDKEFFYDAVRKEHIEDVNIRNIIAYNKPATASAISKIGSGAYAGAAKTVDLQSAGQRESVYVGNIGADQFQKMDDNGAAINSTSNVRAAGKTKKPTAFSLLPIFSDHSKSPLTEAFASRQAFMQYLTNNMTQIHIYGDSELTVGDMIKCNLPSASSFDDQTGSSRLESGNYLITTLRHIILMGDRPQHTISLELVKNDLAETA